jgi:hypothetical protein
MPQPQTFLFPSIASVLAQNVDFKEHVDFKKHVASKDHAPDSSSGPLPDWASEWYRINCLQSSSPLPNVFEQAFIVALNTKDINPSLHILKHTHEEQETATIETAQVAQAVQVQVQVKMQAVQTSNPARCSLAPIPETDTEVPTLSLPPPVLPIISGTPASQPIAPTHKQTSSISTTERKADRKYWDMPEWNYITNRIARSLQRKEIAKKAKEEKALEEESSDGGMVVA